jgi:hypothetical protein
MTNTTDSIQTPSEAMQFADVSAHLRPFWSNFFTELTTGMTEITTAWQNNNLAALAERAHCYKGQVMLFQYHGFYRRLLQLETCVINKEMICVENTLTELQHYFQQEAQRYEIYKNSDC